MSETVEEQVAVGQSAEPRSLGCAPAFFGVALVVLVTVQVVQSLRAGEPLGDTPVILAFLGLVVVLVLQRDPSARIRRVGLDGVELDYALQEQNEQIAEVEARLEARVAALEGRDPRVLRVHEAHEAAPPAEQVLAFLRAYDRWYFNAPRIASWGPKQAGFGHLADLDVETIRAALRHLLAHGRVVTRMSPRGSILYRAAGDT